MMRVTGIYLDQLEREARRLEEHAVNQHDPGEAERLRAEARARRERITRLRSAEAVGVRSA